MPIDPTTSERERAAPASASPVAVDTFAARVLRETGAPLDALAIETFQVNVGLRCNLACHHCHVLSSPRRTEEMSLETMRHVLDAARRAGATTLDITGGAPEMHPHFRWFVKEAVAQGLHVIVRSNLTILLLDGYEDLPAFFAEHGVHVVASLPCYLEENVQKQRGMHVYHESVEALQRLGKLGYGTDERLPLDLIYNPGGANLPPDQAVLEEAYRRELDVRFGIRFHKLFTITNMPIGRFQRDLERDGAAATYDALLRTSFNASTVAGLMCRLQAHVGWDGTLFDCDFNYALHLPASVSHTHVRDFDPATFLARRIRTQAHCFGCTAGAGSSCKGALL